MYKLQTIILFKILNNMIVYTLLNNRKNKILILKWTKWSKLEIERILFTHVILFYVKM